MEFRPCIDIHNGQVKQIVGASLQDEGDRAGENYVSEHDAAWYARKFEADDLSGGHVIMLNAAGSDYFEKTRQQALEALSAWPGHLQIGGGINAENAAEYIAAGASHVIVTSYAFRGGMINFDHIRKLVDAVGKEHIVLDLSCKEVDGMYYIVTDRWQNVTETEFNTETLAELSPYCDEFLVHAAHVEGLKGGIDETVVSIMGAYGGNPVTYAGGIRSMEDIKLIRDEGQGRVNYTVGSALDLYGGQMSYDELVQLNRNEIIRG